jgi:RNA polymerase sigma-70 factor (ECF subfamily)
MRFRNFPDAAPAIGAYGNMLVFERRASDKPGGNDGELLRRFRSGDHEAFGLVYRSHQAAVFRFALHMTGDAVKAADVTQDVFVWLIHHVESFDPARGELAAFLSGVTRKFLLRRRGEELRWLPLDENSMQADAREPEQRGDAEVLRRAIAALPPKYREVVAWCDLEGRSYEEAATLIGCATGTVRSRLHRARALLGRKLEKQGVGRAEKCPV